MDKPIWKQEEESLFNLCYGFMWGRFSSKEVDSCLMYRDNEHFDANTED